MYIHTNIETLTLYTNVQTPIETLTLYTNVHKHIETLTLYTNVHKHNRNPHTLQMYINTLKPSHSTLMYKHT